MRTDAAIGGDDAKQGAVHLKLDAAMNEVITSEKQARQQQPAPQPAPTQPPAGGTKPGAQTPPAAGQKPGAQPPHK